MTDLPYKSSNNCILSLEIFAFRVQPTKHDACLRVSFILIQAFSYRP